MRKIIYLFVIGIILLGVPIEDTNARVPPSAWDCLQELSQAEHGGSPPEWQQCMNMIFISIVLENEDPGDDPWGDW